MIIGRTAENKIKIKTDDPLGLRAVECACCNPCGYDAFIEEEGGGFKKYRYKKIKVSGTFSSSSPTGCGGSYGDLEKEIESTWIYDCQRLETNCIPGIIGVYGYILNIYDEKSGFGNSYNLRTDFRGAAPDGCLAHLTGTITNVFSEEIVEIDELVIAGGPQFFSVPCVEGAGQSVTTTITKAKKICVTTYSDYQDTCYGDDFFTRARSGIGTWTEELSNTPFSAP
jgi:hypothetical protein